MPVLIPGQTHTNKYYKPDPLDDGVEYADIIEDFMDRMATHSHSGTDSAVISLNISKDGTEFTEGVDMTWSALTDGVYESFLPHAAGATYEGNTRKFYLEDTAPDGTTGWIPFEPETVEYLTGYKIFSNQTLAKLLVVTI